MKKCLKLSLLIIILTMIFTTGCTKDDMENINIYVTNYANEYITQKLYGKHATITSIYPDGINIDDYKLSSKQKKDYSKGDLFIYNGLIEKERKIAVDLLSLNPDLKIIDSASILETEYSPVELWLNPSSLLMMSQNIRIGLNEYISSSYLKKEIDEQYDKLKVSLSELDVSYRVAVDNAEKKEILIANPALKYLEKFGLKVYCLDEHTSEKTKDDIKYLIKEKKLNNIYLFKEEKLNDTAKKLLSEYSNVKVQELHKLDNISELERSEKKNYLTINNNNLELIKLELY